MACVRVLDNLLWNRAVLTLLKINADKYRFEYVT